MDERSPAIQRRHHTGHHRGDRCPCSEDDLASAHIVPCRSNSGADRDTGENFDSAEAVGIDQAGFLHHHHAVGTGRNRSARHDPDGLTRLDEQIDIRTRRNFPDHLQRDRGIRASASSIDCPHCIAVDCRVCERRQILMSSDLLGTYATDTRPEILVSRRQCFTRFENGLDRCLDRQQLSTLMNRHR